jgi:hypothetical protein
MSAALIRGVRRVLASLVLALVGCASVPAPVETPDYLRARAEILSASASPERDFTVHSHNDFEQERPLLDALSFGYRSAEVDVIDRSDEVRVTHIGFFTQGSLKELYLDPLQKVVTQKGSVHGDGKPFYLWIEVRAIFSGPEIVPLLRDLLSRYPMLESFDARGQIVHLGPVIAIICGYSSYREDLFRDQPEVPAYLAGNSFDVGKPAKAVAGDERLKWLSLRWSRYVDWDGDGPIPLAQLERLERLVVAIHGQGLKMRFFSNPQTKAFWDLMRDAGVDQAGTDDLARTRAMVPDRFFAVDR